MINNNHISKNLAKAIGGKTARACDGCVKRRARWYCAADDAFLCHMCDGLVHSANQLARRHDRVLLKSFSSTDKRPSSPPPAASWHHGFTRKARTPRGGGGSDKKNRRPVVHNLVPEISTEERSENSEEEQLLYRVPVFDPFVEELCRNDVVEEKSECFFSRCISNNNDNNSNDYDNNGNNNEESCLNGFFPTDMELEKFAADVENLLGRGLETDSFAMEGLGLAYGSVDSKLSSVMVKVEDNEEEEEEKDVFKLSFDYDSHAICGEEDHQENKIIVKGEEGCDGCVMMKKEKKYVLMLKLDYEAVIATWSGQGPPWTAGEPPEIDSTDECWPAVMGPGGADSHHQQYGAGLVGGGIGLHHGFGDGGRAARVSRYREKRRNRLFSKKIRYEVRKLNAEKRPRMKGRFVKRSSFAASASFPVNNK